MWRALRTCIVQVYNKKVVIIPLQLVPRVPIALMCVSVDDHHFLHLATRGASHSLDGQGDIAVWTPAPPYMRRRLSMSQPVVVRASVFQAQNDIQMRRCKASIGR